MSSGLVKLYAKRMFFDSPAVIRAVGRARAKALARSGRYVQKVARSLLKKRTGPSKPGEPPHSHVGTLKRLLLFGYDAGTQTEVIGPIGLTADASPAPHTLEFGATVTAKRTRVVIASRATGSRGGKKRRLIRKGDKLRVARRPYMLPALQKSAPKLPEHWRNAVTRG